MTDIDYGKHSDKGRVTKCDYDEAKLTSNATIKDFFNVDGTDLELIINYSEEDKIKSSGYPIILAYSLMYNSLSSVG